MKCYLIIATQHDDYEIRGIYNDSTLAIEEAKDMSRKELAKEQEEYEESGETTDKGFPWRVSRFYHVVQMTMNERRHKQEYFQPCFRWGVDVNSDVYHRLWRDNCRG